MTTTRARAPRASLRQRRRVDPRRLGGRAIAALALTAFAFFFGIPIVWLLLADAKSSQQLLTGAPFSLGSWRALTASWRQLTGFESGAFLVWLRNSALYSFGALVIVLAVSIPAGYAMALTEFRLRKQLIAATLVVMLIPNTALVLPVFLELSRVHLIGTALSVILPYSFFPFGVYLAYIYFSTSVPRDLLAAARVDGCSELQVFARVALPLATPVIALVGFFSFVQNWNNYFLPFVMLPSSSGYPVQIGLLQLLDSTPAFSDQATGGPSVTLPTLALATVISVAPVVVIFLFSQRFLVSGLTAGGTKE